MSKVDLTALVSGAGGEIVEGEIVGDVFEDEDWGSVTSATSQPNLTYINESGMRDEEMEAWFSGREGRRMHQEIASQIEKWSQSLSGVASQQSIDVFNRKRWDDAGHFIAKMSLCCWAVENDDILSTLADVVEGLMFQKCRFELFDTDQQSIWNQWAADIDLDSLLRKMGREVFKASQVYVGLWWEDKTYRVEEDSIDDTIEEMEAQREEREFEERVKAHKQYVETMKGQEGFVEPPEPKMPEKTGPGRGNRTRRKEFRLKLPTQATVFDPSKVVPVGTLMFGRERFAYVATKGEHDAFGQVLRGEVADGTVLQLIERRYEPTPQDKDALQDLGIDVSRLWLFKEDAVFRHTLTKADYERFAPLRLKPALELLELKAHQRAADRASLIGNTNFIVVITKGTDKHPAKPSEVANLQEQARVIARLPVLVGDHRLNVEIVAPALDHTLQQSRWEVLDARLVFLALRTYAPTVQGGNSSGTGISEMSRVVASGLQNRRHMIGRSLESKIFRKVMERNEDVKDFDEFPSLAFSPRKISLDLKAEVLQQVLKLRDRGDISRETTLEEFDHDQDLEVLRRARERVTYDRVFESSTPHSSPMANPYAPQPPGQLGHQPPGQPGGNVGPNGQPRTEGGRPPGQAEDEPRQTKGQGAKKR